MDIEIKKARLELLKILVRESFKYSEKPAFKLASGKLSNYYINCKVITYNPRTMLLIGNLFYDRIKALINIQSKNEAHAGVVAVGGLTLGADPIAFATAMISGMKGTPLQAFTIRKAQKEHGMMKLIEGNVKKGDNVVIVDDVVTTGGSTIQAIDSARESGLEVVKALVLVDRQEGGRVSIEKKNVTLDALYTVDDLIRCYKGIDWQEKG